jgi:vancomycin permeability regulator SanA
MRHLLLLLLVTLSSCYFLGPGAKKRYAQVKKHAPIDLAIVPGLPLRNGSWDTLLKARILWSYHLYKTGIVKNIIYSGNAVYTPYKEGKVMAAYAQALGIPKEHIFVDTAAEHSSENLYYSYQIATQLGFETIAVATDPFQCAMLFSFSRKNFEKPIHFLPIIYDSIAHLASLNPEIDVTTAYVSDFTPLPEREDYRQRIKASRGSKVKRHR